MGWWSTEKAGVELMQGDEPYDIIGEALDKVAATYEADWGRKPTLAELLSTLETVLGADVERYVGDMATADLVALRARTKKRPRRHRIQVGDFFVVPLPDGRNAFGRVLRTQTGGMGPLVGIYRRVDRAILQPEQLRNGEFMLQPFHSSTTFLTNGEWRTIGNVPVAPGEYVEPKLRLGDPGNPRPQIFEVDTVRNATPEEAEGLEQLALYGGGATERRITEWLAAHE